MSCLKPIGEQKQCPYCGYHSDSPQLSPYLPVRTVVANRYLIGKVIDFNGDGATYMGWDLSQRVAVKIREFLPDAICSRESGELNITVMPGCERAFNDCYQSFLELWRKLMRLMGLSALISVTDVVEDNNTAYAIYEHTEEVPLREYLLSTPTGYIPWERARQMLMPVLSALGTLHSAGIIHRGLSPQTLFVGADGRVKISGFSIWQARTARGDLNPELFSGYAAIEQYGFDGRQGAWTDIYAFAAILYRALIGTDPIVATTRVTNDRLMIPSKFAEQLPAYVINALVNALQILPEDRTRSVEQFRAELSASPTATLAGEIHAMNNEANNGGYQNTSNVITENPSSEKDKKRNTLNAFLITAGVTLLVGIVIFLILFFTIFKDNFSSSKKHNNDDTTSVSGSISETVETIIVPDFTGLSYEAIAKNPVWEGKFSFIIKYEYSDTVKKDYVISQSLSEQTTVGMGSEIELVISKGKEPVAVPNVLGMTYEQAKEKLTESGFICTAVGGNTDGIVVSMSHEPESKHEKGTRIELTVSSPADENPTDSSNSGGSIIDRLFG
ncbi:MAG: PASTA domain-containing protein [Clostridia bacterium]|nr:PASTA domain-containing protein [Clostridia bacterium]